MRDYVAALRAIETALKSMGLAPGSADSDVNPFIVDRPEVSAIRHLEQAHDAVLQLLERPSA